MTGGRAQSAPQAAAVKEGRCPYNVALEASAGAGVGSGRSGTKARADNVKDAAYLNAAAVDRQAGPPDGRRFPYPLPTCGATDRPGDFQTGWPSASHWTGRPPEDLGRSTDNHARPNRSIDGGRPTEAPKRQPAAKEIRQRARTCSDYLGLSTCRPHSTRASSRPQTHRPTERSID